MKRPVLIFLVLICAKEMTAQFNDTINYYLSDAATGIINRTEAAKSYVFNNLLRASVSKNDLSLNSTFSWIYGKQNKVVSNNDFSSTIDADYRKDSSRFAYWALGNYDKSLSLHINHRLQYGAGASYDIIRKNNNRLNISNGILHESSNLKLNDSTRDVYQTWRNSLRLKFIFHIGSIITFEGVHFLQNSLSVKDDYIVKSNSSLSVKIYKWVNFTTALTYNKLNRLKRENLLLTLGLSFEKYF